MTARLCLCCLRRCLFSPVPAQSKVSTPARHVFVPAYASAVPSANKGQAGVLTGLAALSLFKAELISSEGHLDITLVAQFLLLPERCSSRSPVAQTGPSAGTRGLQASVVHAMTMTLLLWNQICTYQVCFMRGGVGVHTGFLLLPRSCC